MLDAYATNSIEGDREWMSVPDVSTVTTDTSSLWSPTNRESTFADAVRRHARSREAQSRPTTAGRGINEVGEALEGREWLMSEATSPWLLLLDKLTDASLFPHLLAFVKLGLSRDDGNSLARRLEELRFDLAEDEDSSNLSKLSVIGLIKFFQRNPNVRDPGLVATESGAVRAEWHRSWSEHFAIEFSSNIRSRFVVFVADPNDAEQKIRISGMCSIESVMDQALPHGVGSWVLR
jgi:hypothetical protein